MKTAQDLRRAREAAGLSIMDCCRLTGTPRTTWQNWETEAGKGNSRRPPPIAFAWLDLYGRSVALGEP